MSFIENIGGEAIGGIIAGMLAIVIVYISQKFRTFELRFLDPRDIIAPEKMKQYTALRMKTGKNHVRISLRPRKGMEIRKIGFSFFDKGTWSWNVGERRLTNELLVESLSYQRDDGAWRKIILVKHDYYSWADVSSPQFEISGGSRRILDLEIQVTTTLNFWEGIMGFRIDYLLSGNPEKTYVNTKFILDNLGRRRPFRAIGKHVLNCSLTEPSSDK